jgi:hypothetical protein
LVALKELEFWLTPAEAGRVMGMSKQDPEDAERVAREKCK